MCKLFADKLNIKYIKLAQYEFFTLFGIDSIVTIDLFLELIYH